MATSQAAPIIDFRGVYKWFGELEVLSDINLKVAAKEVLVICGPSGSGKSTLIRTINRLEEHQLGQIIVDGIELNDDLKNVDLIRREVGMVFQQFNLFPHLSAKANIMLGPIWVRRMPRHDAEAIAMELLERVGIPEKAEQFPGELSGGQQQRVAIARALAMRPKIMLFDEPTPHIVQRRRRDVERWMGAETPFPERVAEEVRYTLSPRYTLHGRARVLPGNRGSGRFAGQRPTARPALGDDRATPLSPVEPRGGGLRAQRAARAHRQNGREGSRRSRRCRRGLSAAGSG